MESIHHLTISKLKPLQEYLKKQRENQKFIRSIEVAATFILISFFMFFAIRPTALTISSLVGDIKSKEIQNRSMKTKINNIIQAQDLFSQVQEKYYIMQSCLPDTPRYAQAAVQFQQSSLKSQTSLNKLTFNLQSDSSKPNYKDFSISVNKQMPFLSTLSFVSDLLANRRLISIDNLRLSSVNKDDKTNELPPDQINLNFSADVLYWNQQNEKK